MILDFIKKNLPYKLISTIDENNVEEFLRGWEDNRVRALIFQPIETVRLRYLIAAFNFRYRIAFG